MLHTNTIKNNLYVWNDRALDITDTEKYDDYYYRIARYNAFRYSYANQLYTTLFRGFRSLRSDHNLYKYVRGIYNPIHRQVETITAYMYGGSIDNEFRFGAIPIRFDSNVNRNTVIDGLRYLSRTSDLRNMKSNYARLAANLGDVFVMVVDDIDNQYVRLEVIEPDKVFDYTTNSKGNIDFIRIGYTTIDLDGNEVNYIYEMSEESFVLGKAIASKGYVGGEEKLTYTMDIIEETTNPYGFVPVIHQQFTNVNNQYGANSYFAQFNRIHLLNDILSITFDGIRKDVDTVYQGKGMSNVLSGETISKGRDSLKIIYTPMGDLVPLTSDLNIEGTTRFVMDMIKSLENDLPVLALQAVREMSQISEPAILAAYGDTIARIEDMQNVLDSGFERSLAMALAIAGYRRYITGFNLDYGTELNLGWNIGTRPIIRSAVDSNAKLNVLAGIDVNNPMARIILEEMGIDESRIEQALETSNTIRTQNTGSQLLRASQERLNTLRNVGSNINQRRNNELQENQETPEAETLEENNNGTT